MPELLRFPGANLPDEIRLQILSFIRIEWPRGFAGSNQYRDWISKPEEHPVHFVVVKNGLLISHVEVLWKHLEQFYGAHGWLGLPEAVTLMGPKDNPAQNDELLMIMFLSEKGKARQESFRSGTIYFGEDTW